MKTQPTHRPFPYYRKSAGGGGGLLFPSPPPVIWPSNAWEKEEEEGGGGGVPGFFLALITFLLLHHHRGRHASERTDGISTIYFTTIYSMSVLLSSGVDVVRIHIFSRFTWQIPVPIYRRTVSGSFLPPSLHPTRPPPLPSSGTTFRPSGLPTTLLRRRGGRSVSFPPLHNICSGGTEDPRENWRSRVCVCLTGCMAARASRSMCWEFVASPRRQNGGSMWPGGNMDWREEYHCDVRGQSLGEIFK